MCTCELWQNAIHAFESIVIATVDNACSKLLYKSSGGGNVMIVLGVYIIGEIKKKFLLAILSHVSS